MCLFKFVPKEVDADETQGAGTFWEEFVLNNGTEFTVSQGDILGSCGLFAFELSDVVVDAMLYAAPVGALSGSSTSLVPVACFSLM